MKGHILSSIFIVFAIVLYAFHSNAGTEEGTQCTTQLYYFLTSASSCSNVNADNLIYRTDISNDQDPNGDMPLTTAAGHPYGCESANQMPCAVGYSLDQIESIAFPNGSRFWRIKPKQWASWKCCVKQPF